MKKKITIGSRGSKLALLTHKKLKTYNSKFRFNDEDVVIKSITTKGDQLKMQDYLNLEARFVL